MVTSLRLLITGANGFIGRHLVQTARARGLPVVGVVRSPAAFLPGGDVLTADLVTDDLASLLHQAAPTVVINAASYGVGREERDADRTRAVNVTAVRNLLAAAKAAGVKRFIQLGSYSEYGDHPGAISETTPARPKEVYGITKAEASALVMDVTAAAPVEGVALRLFNVWGPGERSHRLLPQVIRHCRARTRFPLTAGTQVKEWCYVADVAHWILDIALLPRPLPFRLLNLGSGVHLSVRDMAIAAAKALDGEHLLDFGAVPIPAREVQTGPADLTRLAALLPHRHTTTVTDGIAATIAAAGPAE